MVASVNYKYRTIRFCQPVSETSKTVLAFPLLWPPLFATTTALPPLLFSSLTIFLHYQLPIQTPSHTKKVLHINPRVL